MKSRKGLRGAHNHVSSSPKRGRRIAVPRLRLAAWFGIVVVLTALGTTVAYLSQQGLTFRRPPNDPISASELSLEGLTTEQRTKVVEILDEELCPCGCGHTLSRCEKLDPTCETSVRMRRHTIERVKLTNADGPIR